MRERQLMAAEAGPSDADEGVEEDFAELQDPPFPEPEVHPMLLCDLLAQAAELDAAAAVEEGECYPAAGTKGAPTASWRWSHVAAAAAAALSASQLRTSATQQVWQLLSHGRILRKLQAA